MSPESTLFSHKETHTEGERLERQLTTAHTNKRMNQHGPGCEVVSLSFCLHELSQTRKTRENTHGPATQAMNWVMSSSSRLSTTLQPSGGSLRSCASSFAIRRTLDEARDMVRARKVVCGWRRRCLDCAVWARKGRRVWGGFLRVRAGVGCRSVRALAIPGRKLAGSNANGRREFSPQLSLIREAVADASDM